MIEYPAMVYKYRGNSVFMANCIAKNLIGFGKTEKDAISDLKNSLQKITQNEEVTVSPMYKLSIN